jgi:mRNA interferase MazF
MADDRLWVPDRRDMIWINHSPHIRSESGGEMPGEHPLLVLSTKAFNDRTSLVIGLPMTHSDMNERNPFAVKLVALGETCYVLAHQPKSFDWRVRGARKHLWGQCDEVAFDAACERLNAIISIA